MLNGGPGGIPTHIPRFKVGCICSMLPAHVQHSILLSRIRFLLFVGFPQRNEVCHIPQPICDSGCHCWRSAQRGMNLDEVIGEVIEGGRSRMIAELAGEAV